MGARQVTAKRESLRLSSKAVVMILEAAPDAMVIVNGDGRIELVNAQAEQLFGYWREELLGQPIEMLVPERFRPMYAGRWAEVVANPKTRPMGSGLDLFGLRKDRIEFPAEISISPLATANGILTIAAIRDITDRKQSVETVRASSEERYRVRQDNMLEGCQIIDFGWRYMYLNDAAVKQSRRSKDELLGLTMMEVYPGIEKTEMFAHLRRCMEERTPHRMENLFAFLDGSQGWFELSIEPAPNGIYILSLDITERKRMEKALQESNRLLEKTMAQMKASERQIVQQERLQALGQMASGIAHDFNNSLTPILGFSQLLLTHPENLQNTEVVKGYLETINLSAKDAATLVGRLRDFYRTREASESFVRVGLNEIVGQAISLTQAKWKNQAQANGITIGIETSLEEVPPVMGNEAELRQALANLIINAIDAMPMGGKITLSTRREGDRAVLAVSDTGTGMTEEVRQHCLEPFFTTKGEQGSGMGLPSVYGTVQRHEGTFEIETEVGKGTTFVIRLPLALAKKPDADLVEPEPEGVSTPLP